MKFFFLYSSLIIWFLNDHFFKFEYSNFLTGKLSDFTGLIVFPISIQLLLKKTFTKLKNIFWLSILIVYIPFSIINLSQDFNNLFYKYFFGNQNGIADLTDLLVIPFSFIILVLFKNIELSFPNKTLFILVNVFCFMNTSRVPEYFKDIQILEEEIFTKQNSEQELIWFTKECRYDQFSISIISKNNSKEKIFTLKKSEFEENFDQRLQFYYYKAKVKINLEPGEYELYYIAGDNKKENSIQRKDLNKSKILSEKENECKIFELERDLRYYVKDERDYVSDKVKLIIYE